MGHNLMVKDGKEAMAYVGDAPWHKLGTKVEAAMTSAEAIKAGGLDWNVEKRPVFFNSPNGYKTYTKKHVVVRMDEDIPLGVVGNVYRPVQNREAFSFFDAVIGAKEAVYHTVGALGQGERIWLLAKLPSECWITKEDKLENYVLLSNSHDGGSPLQIMNTPIRVVCQNTLNAAVGQSKEKHSLRHTASIGMKIDDVRRTLGIVDRQFQMLEQVGKHLVSKAANTAVVESLMRDLGLSLDETKESTRKENIRNEILTRFQNGKGNAMASVRGSAWALWNGVTEYVDYARSARGEGADKNLSRAESLLFGSGAKLKQKALDSLIEITK